MEYANIKETRHSNAQYDEIENSSESTPVYHKVSVDFINKHCLIIPYKESSQFVMEILDQELWASSFSDV